MKFREWQKQTTFLKSHYCIERLLITLDLGSISLKLYTALGWQGKGTVPKQLSRNFSTEPPKQYT